MISKIVSAIGAVLLASTALMLPAKAQSSFANALIVASCGQQTYPLGTATIPRYEPLTMLVNGTLCTLTGSGGGAVTQGTSPWVDNISQFGGSNVVTGTGASGAGIPRVTISNDSAIANTGFNVLQGGAATAANNPIFMTLSQGGAVLSSSNPLFEQTVGPSMQAPGSGASATFARTVQGAGPLGTPINTNAQQLAGTNLGAPTAYGTAPTGNAQGVNAYITNSPGVIPLGAATTAAPTYANNSQQPLSLTTAGALRTDASATTQPVSQSGTWANQSQYQSNLIGLSNGGFVYPQLDVRGQYKTSETGSSDPLVGITPAITQSGTSVVGKATAGNLYSTYAVLTAAASAQTYLVTINATAVPASGATITPVDVAIFPSNAIGATASNNYGAGPPNAYSSGIVTLVTTSLTVYTPGAASFIQDRVR